MTKKIVSLRENCKFKTFNWLKTRFEANKPIQGNAFVINLFKISWVRKLMTGLNPTPLILPGAIASIFLLALCSNPVSNAILAVCIKHVNCVQIYILCIFITQVNDKWNLTNSLHKLLNIYKITNLFILQFTYLVLI